MLLQKNPIVALFVNRSTQQWVVRDADGQFWLISGGDNAWERREPFFPTAETDLEPVPVHYKYLFDFPN